MNPERKMNDEQIEGYKYIRTIDPEWNKVVREDWRENDVTEDDLIQKTKELHNLFPITDELEYLIRLRQNLEQDVDEYLEKVKKYKKLDNATKASRRLFDLFYNHASDNSFESPLNEDYENISDDIQRTENEIAFMKYDIESFPIHRILQEIGEYDTKIAAKEQEMLRFFY